MSSNGVLVGLALAANEPVQVKVLNVTSAMDENASFTGEVVAIKKVGDSSVNLLLSEN